MDDHRPWTAARVAREAGLLALVAVIALGPTTAAAVHQPGTTSLTPFGYPLIVVMVMLLPFRHRWPAPTLLAVLAVTLTYWTAGYPAGPVFLALVVALAAVVVRGMRRLAFGVLAAGYLLFPWLGWVIGTRDAPSWQFLAGLAAWLVAVGSLLEVVRHRRERARDAERARAEADRARAQEERLRIAREVHDAVAHTMSLITMQAGVALHLGDDLPPQARDALQVIRTASRESLAELRGILGVLRDVDGSAPLAPAPGLARLDELRRWADQAGLEARIDVGELPRLPRAVDLAAYRIVQESLTNVVRHAGPCRTEVRVAETAGGLLIEVLDDGLGAPGRGVAMPPGGDPGSIGNGIAGMRERALALGGTFAAGPRPGRGFAVRATLPLATRAGGAGRAAERGGAVVTVRVLLADDQVLVRAGLRSLLDSEPDIEVVGEAGDGEEAVRGCIAFLPGDPPDVVLMDIRMPGTDGLEATRRITADPRLAAVHVVVLTTFDLDEYVFEALRGGASGFLLKDAEPAELLRAVRVAASGDALLSPRATRRLVAEYAARARPPVRSLLLDQLTEREREVMALVAAGLSNDEIAGRLFISPATAKTHVSRSMIKLDARDRAQLVVLAYESGLVRPGWNPA